MKYYIIEILYFITSIPITIICNNYVLVMYWFVQTCTNLILETLSVDILLYIKICRCLQTGNILL